MNDAREQPLEYSRQPPHSLASCERLPDGGVRITIPPPLHRRMVQIILAGQILGCIAGPPLLALVLFGALPSFPELFLAAATITAVAYATLVPTLWMGFRWTIVQAGPDGLRLELRGLLLKRGWFLPRQRIGRLHKRVSLLIYDPFGRRIGKIDATDPTEEMWIMEMLRRALNLPPP